MRTNRVITNDKKPITERNTMTDNNQNPENETADSELNISPCYATFHAKGGHDHQRESALLILNVGQKYKVTGGCMYSWNTDLELEGVEGRWNSALFDVDLSTAPLLKSNN